MSSGWFLVVVIPPMIFFVSVIHLLHYWGWIQWMVGKFAAVFFHLMGISGAEAAVAAASPFLGQGESAVLIKTFVPLLTHAELHQIMTSGFATIAGSVLSGYIALGISPLALVSSCAMSIPAAITVSKLRYPEREEPLTLGGVLRIPEDDEGGQPFNSLHALANGSWAGIKIAGMVVASVLCITALLGLVNGLLGWWGSYLDIDNLDIQLIFGYVLYPVAFLLGVERNGDLMKVAKLIGIKIVANEFVAVRATPITPEFLASAEGSFLHEDKIANLPCVGTSAVRRTSSGCRIRLALSPVAPHRRLRRLRLRQHQRGGDPNRGPVSPRTREGRGSGRRGGLGADIGGFLYLDECLDCGYVDC